MARLSYSDKFTNKTQKELEQELSALYKQAYKDSVNKSLKYWNEFQGRYASQYAAYQEGKYTAEQWNAWVNTQVARGESLGMISKDMATRIAKTNEIAAGYINGKTASVYAENANFEAFMLEKDFKGIASFNLVSEDTLRNLASGANQTEFRTVSTNPIRDYEWNFKKIQNSLQQGILQGESIGEITDRFMETMQSNRKAAIRNARTAVTSAQNAGRMDTMNKAADMGLDVQKQWLSTIDDRTRESHIEINGEIVGLDEEFSNGLMYPGDPNGDPAEVYNCRCTLVRARSGGRGTSISSEREYKNWLKQKDED